MKRGFTLIELLVVISIISLLSSLVFSSVRSARSRAEIANGLRFDDQLTKKLYLNAYYLVGDSDGTNVFSDGKESITGTLTGASVTTDSIKGAAYQFGDSSGDNITFIYPDSYENQLQNNSFTFSAWIKPDTLSNEQVIIGNRRGDSLVFGTKNNSLWLRVNDREATSVENLTIGAWQHVAISYSWSGADSDVKFYNNGRQVEIAANGLENYNASIINDSGHPREIYIARTTRGGLTFDGIIDEPKMFYGSI